MYVYLAIMPDSYLCILTIGDPGYPGPIGERRQIGIHVS